MKGNDFWEIKSKWDKLHNYMQLTDLKEFLGQAQEGIPRSGSVQSLIFAHKNTNCVL